VTGSPGVLSAPARDVEFERAWTRQAGESARVDVDELVAFAELRAGGEIVWDLDDRNFAREVLEELADARNYLVWWALQEALRRDPDGEVTAAVTAALAAVAVAYAAALRGRARALGA
jgi:hypothetical protein